MSRDTLSLGFRDRQDAGKALGKELLKRRDWQDPVVLALPRGGVPVGYEVARELDAPLDVLVVRKLGHPHYPEFAMGALASGQVMVMNPETDSFLSKVSQVEMDRIVERERAELERREKLYRGEEPPAPLQGREVILVDDGVATGATMRAAVRAVRQLGPSHVAVAVPVGAQDSCSELANEADSVVCVRTPEPFNAVGQWYSDFPQVPDEEVRSLLASAKRKLAT